MTDLDKTKRALEYITKLADGIDPITDKPVPEGSAYDNVRLCRCFFHVAEVLKQVVASSGRVYRAREDGYAYNEAEVKAVKPSDAPLSVSKFMAYIQEQLGAGKGKVPYKAVTDWLTAKGYLEEKTDVDGRPKRMASAVGRSKGIYNVESQGQYGSYTAVYYDKNAQAFILENLKEILGGSKAPETHAAVAPVSKDADSQQ